MRGWRSARRQAANPTIEVFAQSDRCLIRLFNQYTRTWWHVGFCASRISRGTSSELMRP